MPENTWNRLGSFHPESGGRVWSKWPKFGTAPDQERSGSFAEGATTPVVPKTDAPPAQQQQQIQAKVEEERKTALLTVEDWMADINWNDILVGLGIVLVLGVGAGILSVELEEIRKRRRR